MKQHSISTPSLKTVHPQLAAKPSIFLGLLSFGSLHLLTAHILTPSSIRSGGIKKPKHAISGQHRGRGIALFRVGFPMAGISFLGPKLGFLAKSVRLGPVSMRCGVGYGKSWAGSHYFSSISSKGGEKSNPQVRYLHHRCSFFSTRDRRARDMLPTFMIGGVVNSSLSLLSQADNFQHACK